MKNYIAYYRVSTKKQSLGLDSQQNTVKNYINSINGKLVNEFSEKESGKVNNRIELNKAIEECKRTNSTLIIAKLDRLSRNVSFIFALKDSNVDFIVCDLPQLNTLTLGIFATIAQSERETTSQRTKAALEAKKRQGIKLGSPTAKFTDLMREKAALINIEKANNNVNNKRAYAVISGLIEKGYSLRKIAQYLNENEFKTSRNCSFNASSVRNLIVRYS